MHISIDGTEEEIACAIKGLALAYSAPKTPIVLNEEPEPKLDTFTIDDVVKSAEVEHITESKDGKVYKAGRRTNIAIGDKESGFVPWKTFCSGQAAADYIGCFASEITFHTNTNKPLKNIYLITSPEGKRNTKSKQ